MNPTKNDHELRLLAVQMEYSTLREEAIKRIELRHSNTANTLTFAGVILGVALTTQSYIILLTYPILATFLAMGWFQNEIRLRQIGNYINERLRITLPDLVWDSYTREESQAKATRLATLSTVSLGSGSLFLLTQVVVIILAVVLQLWHTESEKALLGISFFAFLITLYLLYRVEVFRKQGNKPQTRRS